MQQILATGIAAGYHDRYLARDCEHWYAVEQIEPPDIIVALMTKDRFRAMTNRIKAVPSNSMYGIYVKDLDQVAILCDWINSDEGQEALQARAATTATGFSSWNLATTCASGFRSMWFKASHPNGNPHR